MSNGKVCPQKTEEVNVGVDDEDSSERKSRIKIGIQRTLSTAKYESIVIHYEIDEEVSWPNGKGGLAIRGEKVKNWETIFLRDFKSSHDRILNELNLSHKKAYFRNALEEKDYRPEPGEQGELENLEELDTLE